MKEIGELKIISDFRPVDRLNELDEVPKIGNRIDYWQTAKMLCEKDGGHLATREELAQLASEIYVNSSDGSPVKINKYDDTYGLRIKSRYKSHPPLTFGLSAYWSSEEASANSAYYWYFGISLTSGGDYYWYTKDNSNYRAICIADNMQDRLDLINELKQKCENWKHQAELGSDTTNRLSKLLEEKTQECEELKEKIFEFEKAGGIIDEGIAWKGQADYYRKALAEIEELCKKILGSFHYYSQDNVNTAEKIIDIISKAKGEE